MLLYLSVYSVSLVSVPALLQGSVIPCLLHQTFLALSSGFLPSAPSQKPLAHFIWGCAPDSSMGTKEVGTGLHSSSCARSSRHSCASVGPSGHLLSAPTAGEWGPKTPCSSWGKWNLYAFFQGPMASLPVKRMEPQTRHMPPELPNSEAFSAPVLSFPQAANLL